MTAASPQTPTFPKEAPDVAPDIRPIRAAMGLSRERMARILDVSAKTVERWEARGTLPPIHNRALNHRLAQLREIVELGLIVYTPEGFRLFLTAEMPVFDGKNALEFLEHDRGEAVFGALAGDYEGIGF